MRLRHVEQTGRRSAFVFAGEGHVYEATDGRRFYVFTAGDGTRWDACEVATGGGLGAFLVQDAPGREACVRQLRDRLAAGA
jgi:hypothetical protein